MRRTLTTPYAPWSNGILERTHRTITKMIRGYFDISGKNWPDLLPWIQLSFNAHSSNSTSLPPQLLIFGDLPRFPVDWAFLSPASSLSSNTSASSELPSLSNLSFLTRLHQNLLIAFRRVDEVLETEREKQNACLLPADPSTRFPVGSLVWVWQPSSLPLSKATKWMKYWRGPYEVCENVSPALLRVTSAERKDSTLVNIKNVRKYTSIPSSLISSSSLSPSHMEVTASLLEPTSIPSASADLFSSGPRYEVSDILDHGYGTIEGEETRGRVLWYRVRWRGFKKKDWLPATHLDGCSDLIRQYWTRCDPSESQTASQLP